MADAIAVLSAGSSSIKFSLLVIRSAELELDLHGQIEGIYTIPHFIAKKHDGVTVAENLAASVVVSCLQQPRQKLGKARSI